MLSYIIPPYLLNLSIGSHLQSKIKDEKLARLNVIDTNSQYYYHPIKQTNLFSNDYYLNQIIKDKLIYKLAIIGVLGSNPMEFTQYNDDYVYELFEIFKSRIIQDKPEKKLINEEKPSSIFSSTKLGEVQIPEEAYPLEYSKYLKMSLKELLLLTNSNDKYKLPPSFVNFGNSEFFNYDLPISWVPLITEDYLEYLTEGLNMKIENNGHSNITFNATDYKTEVEDLTNSRFYNFITDKPIESTTGIFYYEVEIEQTTTESTKFKPIISMDDNSINSNSSINFSLGYVKQFSNLDNINSLGKINLEKLKKDLYLNEINDEFLNDLKILLSSRPGDFKGSFAISFEDSTFYNSLKTFESLQRAQILNMNRRLGTLSRPNESDNGKIDLAIPFKTSMVTQDTKKVYKTDVVGCGINYISKTIFITLNGILVKAINEKELSSNNSEDNLFNNSSSVYPMIGFKINQLKFEKNFTPTSVKITTNLGFVDFKFDLNCYLKQFNTIKKSLESQISNKEIGLDKLKEKLNKIISSTNKNLKKLSKEDERFILLNLENV
ncbi:unnamed protein product [Candida verbasci]|uniref:Uncharacterized protein n=1 Tax=Candida verbasci TaxID=1227364 RepID=A0A9W4XI35_9ASCO|nr:unnamed protein product [Candida verbasci]